MKAFLLLIVRRPRWVALLALPAIFGCGCTSALWNKEPFAHHYRPACHANLQLSYSKERQDLLVQFSESIDVDTNSLPRCYCLDPITLRVNRNLKPHFVSAKTASG